MRIRLLCLAALAPLVALAAPSLAHAAAAPATHKVVVRPVTSTGHAAAGFHVKAQPNGSVDCSSRSPSPGAVSHNIEACSPSAEYAIACWKAATAHQVLCVRNPASKTVYRIPRTGNFEPTGLLAKKQRAPLLLVLTNGDKCAIRDGGAGGTITGHPKLVATYYCSSGVAVWAPFNAKHFGINESASSWTIRTAQAGNHALTLHHVKKAYFVGTA